VRRPRLPISLSPRNGSSILDKDGPKRTTRSLNSAEREVETSSVENESMTPECRSMNHFRMFDRMGPGWPLPLWEMVSFVMDEGGGTTGNASFMGRKCARIGRRGRLTNRSSRLMFSCSQIPGLQTFHHPQTAQACCVQSSASDSELASRRHGTASAKC
jgi:hypothetical protein